MLSKTINKSKEKLVIWGASGHAKTVADIIRLNKKYKIVGFLDNLNPSRKGEIFCGSTILGGNEQIDNLLKRKIKNVILAFGSCSARNALSKILTDKGFILVNAVHPQSIIASDVILGRGVVVCAGAIINPGAIIGDNVIVNTGSSIDHESVVGDSSHICPGVRLAGQVSIGKRSWIGIGSIVREKLSIGDDVFVGAGSLVLKDIPSGVLVYGSPARIIKN